MEHTGDSSFASLLIFVFLAVSVPFLLTRIRKVRLPIVVGEILAGIIVGSSGLQLVTSDETAINYMAEFGLAFLMFLSGMELDFSNLGINNSGKGEKSSFWNPLTLSIASFLATLLLSSLIGYVLFINGLVKNIWMMALILSTTSLGVVVPVLKENGLIGGKYGQTLLVSALIADFATMLLITVLVAALSHGITLDILLIGLLFVAFFLFYRFGNIFFNKIGAVRKAINELSHATAQIKVRLAMALMLIFVVFAESVGTEIILGAFLAGVIASLLMTPEDTGVTHQLESIGYGFFIPIFFIKVGVDFNLDALASSTQAMILVPLLVLAAALVKLVPSLLYRVSFSKRETLAAGVLLSSRLSLIIAASAIGGRLGVISEAVNAATILVAIITVTFSPILFLRIMPQSKDTETIPIIVAGARELGLQVASQLIGHMEQIVIIDHNPDMVARARERGYKAVQADISKNDPAAEMYLEASNKLICTHNNTDLNYQVCRVARHTYGIEDIIAQVSTPGDISRFEKLGVQTINAAVDRAMMLVLLARNPATYDLLTRTDDDKEVVEVDARSNHVIGRRVRQIKLPGDVLIMAIRRDGELMVPHGNTMVQQGDSISLAGSIDCINIARRIFSL